MSITYPSLFVTGTNTDIGKTFIAGLLVEAYKSKSLNVGYFKPVQTGTVLDNESVKSLAGLSESKIIPNAYLFDDPISPNRAAKNEARPIELGVIKRAYLSKKNDFDAVIVEGAGGVEVPLSENIRISDLPNALGIPLIIVASTELGTINHTILSYEKMKQKGTDVLGVLLNGDEDPGLESVLEEQGVVVLGRISKVKTKEDRLRAVDSIKIIFDKLTHQRNLKILDGEANSHLVEKWDQDYVWHPFTQHKFMGAHYEVVSGKGSYLNVKGVGAVLDGISSWWVNLHGHSNPIINQALAEQSQKIEHTIFAGFTHEPAALLSKKLVGALQKRGCNLEKVFFSDNGSTAVEVALKMAFQFHKQSGSQKRDKFLALKDSYHGDTLGAMSVSAENEMTKVFEPLMSPVDFVDINNLDDSLDSLQPERYAALIVEPMVQGAGGMKMHSVAQLEKLCLWAKSHGVLLVFDEIFTGFGRTGSLFAFEHTSIKPDLLCLSKGLTAGYLPMSVTVATQEIYGAFLGDSLRQAFLHGHSYTANPLACAVALASLDLTLSEGCEKKRLQIASSTSTELEKLKEIKNICNIRSLGTIGAFDIKGMDGYFQGNFGVEFGRNCLKKGALVRPLGGTIYTVPPYCTTKAEVERIYEIIKDTLREMF